MLRLHACLPLDPVSIINIQYKDATSISFCEQAVALN